MREPVAVDDNHTLRSIPTARIALIERIARAATGTTPTRLRQKFLRTYFHGVGEEDLAERSPKQLACVALEHLSLRPAAPRALAGPRFQPGPGARWVRVTAYAGADRHGRHAVPGRLHQHRLQARRARAFTSSCTLCWKSAVTAAAASSTSAATVTATAPTRLPAESWQLYEIDRQTDPAQIEKIQHDIEATLADVRAAVADWSRDARTGPLGRHAPGKHSAARSRRRRRGSTPPAGWMEARHFVFLGYRHYTLERGAQEDRLVPDPRSGLGILRDGKRKRKGAGATVLRGDVAPRRASRNC